MMWFPYHKPWKVYRAPPLPPPRQLPPPLPPPRLLQLPLPTHLPSHSNPSLHVYSHHLHYALMRAVCKGATMQSVHKNASLTSWALFFVKMGKSGCNMELFPSGNCRLPPNSVEYGNRLQQTVKKTMTKTTKTQLRDLNTSAAA